MPSPPPSPHWDHPNPICVSCGFPDNINNVIVSLPYHAPTRGVCLSCLQNEGGYDLYLPLAHILRPMVTINLSTGQYTPSFTLYKIYTEACPQNIQGEEYKALVYYYFSPYGEEMWVRRETRPPIPFII